ncbi:nicotinate-nucleotide adenylyltransferase [Mycoplasma sp. 'Moose RK']|uniref:nicotinate-nucleotide adenylyltransferase n=1 Tax=Mycoplasma sp. 'Moose RK' TaxID=2780095 RepID=UPI0018C2E95D|nr:nicotinate-nucleotide adenylyltransferase [Mycoplasma sp. 'Moose RK']MBG0730755.1 nicotinate-nucleotide adenylyltransferase [Mycoplasma sp. 'Moose RK']
MNFKKIAIYGGTFNPVHRAHVEIAQRAIDFLNVDQLFFVPNYLNPLKKRKKNNIAAEHRFEMLKLIEIPKSTVSDFEIKAKKVSYTIDTVNFFHKKYPNCQIFLIIGSDNLKTFKAWKNYKEILEKVQLVVFARKGFPNISLVKRYNALILPVNLPNFSSSEIRKGDFSGLDLKVQKYIGKNFLYADSILESFVGNSKRLIHSRNTAKLAKEYALIYNLNSKLAYFSGLFHDLTKTWPREKHLEFLKSQNQEITHLEDYQLHQLSAAIWLENVYFLPYKEVIYAISCHTSLCFEMSIFDKAIYVADKLARGRKFFGIQNLRQLAKQDLEQAFKILVQKAAKKHQYSANSNQQEALYEKHKN